MTELTGRQLIARALQEYGSGNVGTALDLTNKAMQAFEAIEDEYPLSPEESDRRIERRMADPRAAISDYLILARQSLLAELGVTSPDLLMPVRLALGTALSLSGS